MECNNCHKSVTTRDLSQWRDEVILAAALNHPCTIKNWIEAGLVENYKVASTISNRLQFEGRLREVGSIRSKRRGAPIKVFCNGWTPNEHELSWEVRMTSLVIGFWAGSILRGVPLGGQPGAVAFGGVNGATIIFEVRPDDDLDRATVPPMSFVYAGVMSSDLALLSLTTSYRSYCWGAPGLVVPPHDWKSKRWCARCLPRTSLETHSCYTDEMREMAPPSYGLGFCEFFREFHQEHRPRHVIRVKNEQNRVPYFIGLFPTEGKPVAKTQ